MTATTTTRRVRSDSKGMSSTSTPATSSTRRALFTVVTVLLGFAMFLQLHYSPPLLKDREPKVVNRQHQEEEAEAVVETTNPNNAWEMYSSVRRKVLLKGDRNAREPDQKKNRTLVVVLGSLRGGEVAWRTLYERVLDPSMADLALMVGFVNETKRNSSLYERAKHVWMFREYEDWGDAVDLARGGDRRWRKTHLPHVPPSGFMGGVGDRHGSGARE